MLNLHLTVAVALVATTKNPQFGWMRHGSPTSWTRSDSTCDTSTDSLSDFDLELIEFDEILVPEMLRHGGELFPYYCLD